MNGSSTFAGRRRRRGSARSSSRTRREVKALTAYFAWATWATVANRPGKDYSYTNNWPYEPLVGNRPSSSTYLWSALSLITLLGGIGAILFFFGKFDYLGWGGEKTPGALPRQRPRRLEAHAQPMGHGKVLRGGGRAVLPAEPGRRRPRPLPGRAGGLLRPRHRLAPSLQPAPHLAPPTGDLLDRHGLGGRRSLPGAARWGARSPRDSASARTSSSGPSLIVVLGSLLGEWLGHQRPAGGPLVLAGPPGLGVPRPRAVLAAPARRRPRLLAGPHVPRPAARHEEPPAARAGLALPLLGRGHSRSSTCPRSSTAPTPTSRSSTTGASGSSTSGSRASSSSSPRCWWPPCSTRWAWST